MEELADSTSLLNDQGGLRRRLAGDGYLFFRGLLPAAEVRAVGMPSLTGSRLRSSSFWDRPPGRRSCSVGCSAASPGGNPVPAGMVLYPRAQLVRIPPGPSRLVAVHPGWRHWQPPRAVP